MSVWNKAAAQLPARATAQHARTSETRCVPRRGRCSATHAERPSPTCEARDPKGLYKKARSGEIKDFTGISAPYEEPDNAQLTIDTSELSVDESVETLVNYVEMKFKV